MIWPVKKENMYDITIVGAGVSGIFLAYTLLQAEAGRKILIIEKGRKFTDRTCQVENGESEKCLECKVCNRLQGFGGMGRSEGKFNYTTDFGGSLSRLLGREEVMELMESADRILCSFGADKVKLYSTQDEELKKRAESEHCRILTAKVRHLGTSLSYKIIDRMYDYLREKADIKFETEIVSIEKTDGKFIIHHKESAVLSKKLVFATGISGGKEFLSYMKAFHIEPYRCRVDFGIRVEMKRNQLNNLLKNTFETKLQYKNNDFTATTYCMNPGGKIVKKYLKGLVMADGQNCYETDSPSSNLNFAIFVPQYFTSSDEAEKYVSGIIRNINKGRGRVAVQRLEDLKDKRPTTNLQLANNSIHGTLIGEGGNLHDEIPGVYINALFKILESIECLTRDKILEDTLLYGADAKFYEPEIKTDLFFETEEKGLYVIGDCSGITWSLSQAAASGIYLGRHLISK